MIRARVGEVERDEGRCGGGRGFGGDDYREIDEGDGLGYGSGHGDGWGLGDGRGCGDDCGYLGWGDGKGSEL